MPFRFFILTSLCLAIATLSFGQTPFPPDQPQAKDSAAHEQQPKGVVENDEEPDSVLQHKVFAFHLAPLGVKIADFLLPSLSPDGAQFNSDPLDALNGSYYLSKGLVGQSHLNIFPSFGDNLDWLYQPDVNVGYAKKRSNILFLQTQRPYTALSYASSLKKEYVIHASHSQNISPRWNFSLDYDLINPDAIFSNSSVQNHYLDITSNYYSADSRYQAYAGLIWQKFYIHENEGLMDDNIFSSSLQSNFTGIPVNNYNGLSLYNSLNLFTHHSFNLVRQVQTIKERSSIQINPDDSSSLDTLYWNDTLQPGNRQVLNPGVLGLDASLERSARRFSDSTTSYSFQALIFWTNDAYIDKLWHNPLKLSLGIAPRYVKINEHDSLFSSFASISPSAQALIRLGHHSLDAYGEFSLGNGYTAGDRLLRARYSLSFDSTRSASVYASLSAASPNYFYHHYHSNRRNWDNDLLQKIATQKIGINYSRSGLVDCDVIVQHVAHNVWLSGDSTLIHVEQANGDAWLLQGRLTLKLMLWNWLHYDMQQFLQFSSDQHQIPVPLFASKNSLYANVFIFKRALRLQVGVDLRYHTPFHADAFDAPSGAFVRQDDILVGNYLWSDVFVNLQIKRATIYLKAGHVNSLWEQHPNYFLLPHYPGNKFGLYYGISWKFFD